MGWSKKQSHPEHPFFPNALIFRPGLPRLSWSELRYPRSKYHQTVSEPSRPVFESISELIGTSPLSYTAPTTFVAPSSWVRTRNTPSTLTSPLPKTSSPLPIHQQHNTQGKHHYKRSKMPFPSTKWRLCIGTWHILRMAF